REQLRERFVQLRDGGPTMPPPQDIDAFNAAKLAQDAGVPLADAARRSDQALLALIDMWKAMGDRPFTWYVARTPGEALIRNSYAHPRNHLAEHFIERGDRAAIGSTKSPRSSSARPKPRVISSDRRCTT